MLSDEGYYNAFSKMIINFFEFNIPLFICEVNFKLVCLLGYWASGNYIVAMKPWLYIDFESLLCRYSCGTLLDAANYVSKLPAFLEIFM